MISTTSGYIGGRTANPSYEEVLRGGTGHAEAVEIVYDPAKVSYQKLLDVFWHNIDPLVKDRQFCDRGDQYRSAIFYHGDEQKPAGGGLEDDGRKPASSSRSRPRSWRPGRSTRPRTITRTTI